MRDSTKALIYLTLVILFIFYTGQVYLSQVPQSNQTDPVMKGKMVWQEKNCNACHQVFGLGGFLGPDLTNIYSAQGKGPEYIKAFVQNGTVTMPSFDLSNTEYTSLLAFLQSVDASGKSSPRIFKANWNGTIENK